MRQGFVLLVICSVQYFSATGGVLEPKKGDNFFESVVGTSKNFYQAATSALEGIKSIPGNLKYLTEVPFIIDSEIKLKTTDQLISDLGFPVEIHNVTTEDGYILGVHRIPFGKNQTKGTGRPVVFMQHGLLATSSTFLMNYFAEQNLATILADDGYDVWLGNFRGTEYSMGHVSLTPKDPNYWEFRLDDLALKDLPAMMNYVLSNTSQSQLSYVGHSLGTTAIFAFLSRNISYNSKVKIVAAMAPIAKVTHIATPISRLYQFVESTQFLSIALGTKGFFFPYYKRVRQLLSGICNFGVVDILVCNSILEISFGNNIDNENRTRIPFILTQTPSSTSTYVIKQYVQGVQSERFQMYDFEKVKNIKVYGQADPPEYFPQNITAPIGLFSSNNDKFAVPQDVDYLRMTLPNIAIDFVVPDKDKFTHSDFVFAENAYKIVYESIVNLLGNYNKL